MGEYNIHTLNEMQESAPINQQFYNIFSSHYYHKLINLPTQEESSTRLDNIYTPFQIVITPAPKKFLSF